MRRRDQQWTEAAAVARSQGRHEGRRLGDLARLPLDQAVDALARAADPAWSTLEEAAAARRLLAQLRRHARFLEICADGGDTR